MKTSEGTDTSTTSSFTTALGAQLVVAHGRLRRRRRRRQTGLAMAVVAVVALFATASLSLFDPQQAAAEPVKVERLADGSMLITIDKNGALPADLNTALLGANINNITREMTTGPSRVGTIVSVAFDQPVTPFNIDAKQGRELVLPAGYAGTVMVGFGVAAPRGSPYDQPADAFVHGEPFAGFDKPTDAAAVAKAAVAKHLRVTIMQADGTQRVLAPGEHVAPGTTLVGASMTSAADIGLRLAG
jgi:hypothetical protein